MKSKKILLLIDSLGIGGAEKLLLSYLKYFDRDLFEPIVCVFAVRDGNPLAREIENLGVKVDIVPVKNMRDISALPRLLKYLKANKFDMIHMQLSFANTLGSIAAKILGIPSICTLHTLKNPKKGTFSYWRFRLMGWSLKNFCDRIVTVSDATGRHYIKALNFPPKKVTTIYNGIEIDKFSKVNSIDRKALRKKLEISENKVLLLTVAVLRQDKGLQFMLHAIPALIQDIPELMYLIVGDGKYRKELEKLSRDLGIEDFVKFVGFKKEIDQYMSISDVFILPSLTEALPTVIAEAMAIGMPIISTKVGGVPEMIINNENGILVRPKNTIELEAACLDILSGDRHKAQVIGTEAKLFVNKKFNLEKQIKVLEETYSNLMEGRG